MFKKWIVITDGCKGKVLEKNENGLMNIGFTHHLEEFATPQDKDHHAPGRARSSFRYLKSSYPSHIDPHERKKMEFSKGIAGFINDQESKFESLLVIAPAKTLGMLRRNFNQKVSNKMIKAIQKNYMHTPIEELTNLF